MRISLVHIVAAFFLTVSCGLANHNSSSSNTKNTFGFDNRVVVKEQTMPFSSIGRLDSGCTGTLIGKRLMLTAAHCVVDIGKPQPKPNFQNFSANIVDGKSNATAKPVRAWIGGIEPEKERLTDWAVVELSEPLGERQGFMSVSNANFQDSLPLLVHLSGYNADLANGDTQSIHWGCHVRSFVNGRMLHDCDSTTGISGGPLFRQNDNNWQIAGISVSEYRKQSPRSVHRDEWSEEFSNVGVPSTLFSNNVEALKSTVDQGDTAPDLTNVVLLTFHQNPTPTPQPAPIPQPLPVPTPQPSDPYGYIPYPVTQIANTTTLYHAVTFIHDIHYMLIRDTERFKLLSRQANHPYYMFVADRLETALSAQITAYNRLTQDGPLNITSEELYAAYVQLKSAQNQVMSLELTYFPPPIAMYTRQQQMELGQHISNLEQRIFFP